MLKKYIKKFFYWIFFIDGFLFASNFTDHVKKISLKDLKKACDLYTSDLQKTSSKIVNYIYYDIPYPYPKPYNVLISVFDQGKEIVTKDRKMHHLYTQFLIFGQTINAPAFLVQVDEIIGQGQYADEDSIKRPINPNESVASDKTSAMALFEPFEDPGSNAWQEKIIKNLEQFFIKNNVGFTDLVNVLKKEVDDLKVNNPFIFVLLPEDYSGLFYGVDFSYSILLSFLMSTHIQNLVDKNAQNLVDKNAQIYFFKKITFSIFSLAFCYYLYCKFLY